MAEGESSELAPGEEAAADAVLIIDDDRHCRSFCARVLEARGYRVDQARNADEALRVMQAVTPVLVLCDLRLPDPVQQHRLFATWSGASGSDTTGSDTTGSDTAGSGTTGSGTAGRARPALLLMSADEARSGRDGCLPLPAVPLLRKPFLAEALLDAAERAVRQTGRALPAQAGVRDEPRPSPDLLAEPFRAALREELGQLDREISEGRWQAARDTLHRLRGGAAMCGFGAFAEAGRRLAESIGHERSGWTARYLELLRAGEDALDRP